MVMMGGLARNPQETKIHVLPWSAFRWKEGVIRITATQFFRPKSRESEGDVLVDPELIEIFRGYHDGQRVISSSNAVAWRRGTHPMVSIAARATCGN
jgi:hypothetical protein